MRQERLYISIGIFVFGAFLLAAVGVVMLYSQYLHGKVETYVMFFKGSLSGLNATSSITYRGIKIGEVSRIELTANKSKSNVAIPVYVEFFVEKSFVQRGDPIQILIDNGIVATITSPNILTGTASIELIPTETGTKLISKTFHGYRRFPTETSPDEETSANDTLKAARKTLRDISKLITSKDFKDTITAVREMATSINSLSISIDKKFPSMSLYFNNSMQELSKAANSLDDFAKSVDKQIPGMAIYFNDGMKELTKAAYSLRNLTDYITRHPESLLRGRG